MMMDDEEDVPVFQLLAELRDVLLDWMEKTAK